MPNSLHERRSRQRVGERLREVDAPLVAFCQLTRRTHGKPAAASNANPPPARFRKMPCGPVGILAPHAEEVRASYRRSPSSARLQRHRVVGRAVAPELRQAHAPARRGRPRRARPPAATRCAPARRSSQPSRLRGTTPRCARCPRRGRPAARSRAAAAPSSIENARLFVQNSTRRRCSGGSRPSGTHTASHRAPAACSGQAGTWNGSTRPPVCARDHRRQLVLGRRSAGPR